MIIQGENYLLRPWKADDCASLVRHISNIKIWNNVRDRLPYPYTEKDAREYIDFVNGKSYIQDFAIEVNGQAVGGVGFEPQSDVERFNAELGYWLGEEYWNRGIMSDAVKILVAHVFSETEFVRLYASVYEYNFPSMRVLLNAGFFKIGVMHKAVNKNGSFFDTHCYELLKR